MERTPEGWSRELKNGVYVLTRTFQFGDFAKAMEFAVRVGAAADDADHHPEITVSWGVARVDWWSHDAKGVTARDVSLAETTNQLYA